MDKVGCEQITRKFSDILSFSRLYLVCSAKRTEEAGLREFQEMYKRARIVFVAEARHAADGGQGGVQGKDHQECLAHAQSCLHPTRPAIFPVQSAAVYLTARVNPQMQPLASVIILSDGVYRHVWFLLQTDCTCCMCLRVKWISLQRSRKMNLNRTLKL